MIMDAGEVEYEYRHASNPLKQIQILAELNGTIRFEVCHVLYERGVLQITKGAITEKYLIARALHNKKTDTEIMKELGVRLKDIDNVRLNRASEMWVFDKDEVAENDAEMEKVSKPHPKNKRVSTYKILHEEKEDPKDKKIKGLQKEIEDAFETIELLQRSIYLEKVGEMK